MRTADILGPSPYSGEEGDAWSLNHPSPKGNWTDHADVQDLKLVYLNGQLHISDKDDYDQLARNAGSRPDHTGPMIFGKAHVDLGKADFQVHTNLHARGVEKILQILAQKQGWQIGSITDFQGSPLSDSKISSLYFESNNDQLKFAHHKESLRSVDGAIHISGKNAYVYPFKKKWYEPIKEWADDTGRVLYAAHDNVIKTVEDLEEHNVYSPNWNDEEDHFLGRDPKEQSNDNPEGPQKCEHCNQLFPTINALIEHRKNDVDSWSDAQTRPPVIEYNDPDAAGADMDNSQPPRFREREFLYGAVSTPMGFIYDIKHDKIILGNPGETADTLNGRHNGPHYTPGGIVQGTYDNGKLTIGSLSDYSITVSHLLQLWSWTLPNYPLRQIFLDDGTGRVEKLAQNESIWEL